MPLLDGFRFTNHSPEMAACAASDFEETIIARTHDANLMTLTSGTKLGPYEIQSLLGAGGMGEVYRARDTRLDRTVAVKVLASHLSSSPELKQRMEREGR